MSRWDDFWAKLLAKIDKWLEQKQEPTPNPIPTPQPEPQPDPHKGETEHSFSNSIPITCSMDFIKASKSGVYFKCSKRYWKVERDCDGEFHMGVNRNGKWTTAKVDHIRPNSTSRDFKNLNPANPYGKWDSIGVPKSGEQVCAFAVNYSKSERTNAIFFAYP